MAAVNAQILIKAEDLVVGYNSETIVQGINFELRKGQAIALIGTNGSGKSTLLRTLINLIQPLGGRISVFGMKPGTNPRRIAYLGQYHSSGFILPLCTVDVVRMGRFPLKGLIGRMTVQDEEIVRKSMQRMGIEHLANTPLRFLSGGQQQRTYLAQVLAHQADLLVLDEPTAGLDASGRELYLEAVSEEMERGAALVAATHDIQEEASMCDQVMLLARRVVALGPPRQVLTSEALLQTFGIVVSGGRITVIESKHGHDK